MAELSEVIASATEKRKQIAKRKDVATELTRDERTMAADAATSGLTLLLLTEKLLGPQFLTYEPETLWRAWEPYGLPAQNKDKISAALACILTGAYFHDWRVHGATASTLAGELTHPELLPSPEADELNWAAIECTALYRAWVHDTEDPEEVTFSDEVTAGVALYLWHNGWITTPDYLDFACDDLCSHLSPESQKEGKAAREAFDRDPTKEEFGETAVEVQRSRLAHAKLYVDTRTDLLARELDKITA